MQCSVQCIDGDSMGPERKIVFLTRRDLRHGIGRVPVSEILLLSGTFFAYYNDEKG